MTKMTLPMASMPVAISESVAAVLKVHGLSLTPELLREIGNNATHALNALSERDDGDDPYRCDMRSSVSDQRCLLAAGHSQWSSLRFHRFEMEEPTMSDRLAVGETLRALAMLDKPNPETAKALGRVGEWLSVTTRVALKGGKAA